MVRSGLAGAARPQVKEVVARALATAGGYVDAVGYVALFGLFTAHQSGNSAGLGVALGTGDWREVWRRGAAIAAYVIGVLVGSVIVEVGRHHGVRSIGSVVSGLEIALLLAALGVGQAAAEGSRVPLRDTSAYAAAAVLLAGGMGVQTVVLRRVGRRTVRTTFVTGLLTDFAQTLVVGWFRPEGRPRRPVLALSGLLGSMWLLYLGGAVAGAVAERSWSFAALAPAIALVAVVAAWEHRVGHRPTLPERGLFE